MHSNPIRFFCYTLKAFYSILINSKRVRDGPEKVITNYKNNFIWRKRSDHLLWKRKHINILWGHQYEEIKNSVVITPLCKLYSCSEVWYFLGDGWVQRKMAERESHVLKRVIKSLEIISFMAASKAKWGVFIATISWRKLKIFLV